MSAEEKEVLLEEISRLESELHKRRTRLSVIDRENRGDSSRFVIVPGDSMQANRQRLHALVEEIGKRSRGGDSVEDVAEMREG